MMIKTILFFILFINNIFAYENDHETFHKKALSQLLQQNKIITDVKASDYKEEKKQELTIYTTGLHPKSCLFSSARISQYESYPLFVDYIKESFYSSESKNWHLLFESPLIPASFTLDFTFPRLTQTSENMTYPFHFPTGIFKDLKGTVSLEEIHGRCRYTVRAYWKGEKTFISSPMMEFFIAAVAEIGMRKLFQFSK